MRKPSKSMAMRQFDQAWERFCILLPAAPAPILARLHAGALLQATGSTAPGQDMDDEQAASAVRVLDHLCCQIADYRRARRDVIDAFVGAVCGGRQLGYSGQRLVGVRMPTIDSCNWRKAAAEAVEALGGI